MNKALVKDKLRGVLLGTTVGDALGLPAEGLKRSTIEHLGWKDNWQHRLILGRGMISDDTEHSLFVAQALLKYANNAGQFQKSLAWKLKWWLLAIPAGIGFGTLRAILKLWVGFPPSKSGVYSAGNGPAMRCAIIGARFAADEKQLFEFTRCSTELTHSDPKALTGALAISYSAKIAFETEPGKVPDIAKFFSNLAKFTQADDIEWREILSKMEHALSTERSVASFAHELGLDSGVSGYIYHSVPVAIYSWLLNYSDFQKTLIDVLNCGGDTDTVGAITAALAGATVGETGIPVGWLSRIIEYPRNCNLLSTVADRLSEQLLGLPSEPVRYFWLALLPRNLFFTIVVLCHGFIRLLPAKIRKYILPR